MGFENCLNSAGGTIIGAGIHAGLNATVGTVGAAILSASGYSDYNVKEAAEIGAIGGSIIGSVAGLLTSSFKPCGLFSRRDKRKFGCAVVFHTSQTVLSGLIGREILNSTSKVTVVSLNKTAATVAVGSAITLIPPLCVLMCIGFPLILRELFCIEQEEENVIEENHVVVSQV